VALIDSRVYLARVDGVGSTAGRKIKDQLLLKKLRSFNGRIAVASESEMNDLTRYI